MPEAPKPPNELSRLAALRRYRLLDTAPEQAFDDAASLAAAVCATPIALVSLVDENRQWFKSRIGIPVTETPREMALCAHAILGAGSLIVEDATRDARFADSALVTGAPHLRFYAGAPLIDRDGHALGTLCVLDHVPRQLAPAQQSALEALSRLVLAQIELRRTADELAGALDEMKTLQALLPVCAWCHEVRDDDGYWSSLQTYLSRHHGTDYSHGICPDCYARERITLAPA